MLLDIPTVCSRLAIKRSTFYELAAAGELKILKIGRRSVVAEADVVAFVERLRAGVR